jgi:hypothetical protein
MLFGGILTWHNWCLWKGWPTTNAIVQANEAGTLSLLALDGAYKSEVLQLTLGFDDPIENSFPTGKSILIKVHPRNNEKVHLSGSLLGFLASLVIWLSLPIVLIYKSLTA